MIAEIIFNIRQSGDPCGRPNVDLVYSYERESHGEKGNLKKMKVDLVGCHKWPNT